MLIVEQAENEEAPIRVVAIADNTENSGASELSWAMEFV